MSKPTPYTFKKFLKTKQLRHPLFWLMFFARIGVGFSLFLIPFTGWLLSNLLDYLDSIVWDHMLKMGRNLYELLDKYVDMAVNVIMLMVSISYGSFWPLLALLVFRLLGQKFFWRTHNEIYLVLFPNFFEAYWVWSVALTVLSLPPSLSFLESTNGLIFLGALKLIHEIYVHYLYPKYFFEISMKYVWHRKPIN